MGWRKEINEVWWEEEYLWKNAKTREKNIGFEEGMKEEQ
jgi:hypothetical protein